MKPKLHLICQKTLPLNALEQIELKLGLHSLSGNPRIPIIVLHGQRCP